MHFVVGILCIFNRLEIFFYGKKEREKKNFHFISQNIESWIDRIKKSQITFPIKAITFRLMTRKKERKEMT